MSAILSILVPLIFQPLIAATFEAPVQEGDRLVFKGFDAQVQITGVPGSKTLRISGVEESNAEGVFVVAKKGNVVEVRMNEFDGKRAWIGALPKASTLTKKIEISGLSVPTEIHLHSGSVMAQKWTKDMRVSMTQGRFTAMNGVGALQAFVQRGDVTIQDHTGKVEADTYNGNMRISNVQGDSNVSLFSGQLQVEKVRGFLTLAAQQSTARVTQGSGTLQFESGRGSVNIQSHQGRIEGQNQEAAVTITMSLESELDIRTKSGRINIATPAQSGMSLNLMSVEGEIVVPAPLRVTRLSAERSVRGRLRGDAQKGTIFVRSQDGSISVK